MRLLLLVLVAGCSPRNGLVTWPPGERPGDDDDSALSDACAELDNGWPAFDPSFADYEGTGPFEGDRLPAWTLQDQHGDRTCLEQHLGKPLVVDVSAGWCGPCREAAAASMGLLADMLAIAPSDFVTVLSQDDVGAPPTPAWATSSWVSRYGITYPVVLDPEQSVYQDWQIPNFPVFFLVAPDGTIARRVETEPTHQEILDFVASYAR